MEHRVIGSHNGQFLTLLFFCEQCQAFVGYDPDSEEFQELSVDVGPVTHEVADEVHPLRRLDKPIKLERAYKH